MNFGSIMLFGEGPSRPFDALVAGKLLAVLFGAGGLGLAFALFPLRAPAATRADVLIIALALAVQVMAYAYGALGSTRNRHLLVLFAPLMVPGLYLLRAAPLAVAGLAAMMALALALETALLWGARRLVMPLAALAVPALVALAVSAPLFGGLVAGLTLLVAPLFAATRRVEAQAAARPAATEPTPNAMPALLAAALAPEGRHLIVTDAMGAIDATLSPPCGEAFPEGSLTEAALIADRVALLRALAQAAREGQAPAPLSVRLREGHGGAGYPTPPRFHAHVLRIVPFAGRAGRALVLIDAALSPREVAPVAPSAASPALINRALHDSMAPFNAGLGFLELVADPRLAPRDFKVLHDFAAEAHKAFGEAHRNSVLLGLWLRQAQDEAHWRLRSEIGPRRLVTEVLRTMNLEEMEKRGDLVVAPSLDAAQSYTVPVAPMRFALAVLLRAGAGAAHLDLGLKEEGDDLVFTLERREAGDHVGAADAFQQALEQVAASSGEMAFEAGAASARRLRLRGAAATRRTADSLRIAS